MRTIILALFLGAVAFGQATVDDPASPAHLYQTHCAGCHGTNMEGAQYAPLRKQDWMYGGDQKAMVRTVMYGISNTDMPPWSRVLSEQQAEALVDYIIESQDALPAVAEAIPDFIQTADYRVRVETLVADGFNSSPWGIEFVDERRALITERRGGLRWMVDGKLDPMPISGTPEPTQYGDS